MLNTRHLQKGAAALAAAALLLFGTSIAVFYLNRSLIFEQKSSANQVRSTTALEIAEAGLEWATGMLNAPFDIDTACNLLSTTNVSFRRKYVQTYWSQASAPPSALYESTAAVVPAMRTYPGCKINGTTLTCSCPNLAFSSGSALTVTDTPAGTLTGTTNENTTVAALGAAVQPGFTVAFSPVTSPLQPAGTTRMNDPEAVRVTVTGCTATANACSPGTATAAAGPDAVAVVSAIIKLRPLLRAAPASALTCGNNCNPGGSYNVINTDPSTNGITINAGGTISTGAGTTVATMPGLPPGNSQVAGDNSLLALSSSDPTCSNSAMFQSYFGTTITEYAASPSTKVIAGCTQANSCGSLVDTAYAEGWRSFYFPDGFARNSSSGSLGTQNDPVTLVTPAGFDVNGNISIYGMIFSNSSNVNDLGTGTADIFGGIVVCRDHSSNGNGTIAYDPTVMRNTRRSTAVAVRVPGSWTDSCRLSNADPPVLTCN